MLFDRWLSTDALLANDIADLITSSVTTFPAAVQALAKAVDGLNAGKHEDYLDYMCPWLRYSHPEHGLVVTRNQLTRVNDVLVMSGCGLAVMAMWRCLGISGAELWRRYMYNPAMQRYGAIADITEIAKVRRPEDEGMNSAFKGHAQWRAANVGRARAEVNKMYSSCIYTPEDMRSYSFDLFNVGDVWRVDDPEPVFTVLESNPVPVEVDGDTLYSLKCLHGGRRTKDTNRQLIEIADTEVVVKADGDVFYVDSTGKHRKLQDIIRACFIPRKESALLPPDWEELLPPEPEPEVYVAPANTAPPAQGTFANKMLQTAISTQGDGYRTGLPGVHNYAFSGSLGENGLHKYQTMWSNVGPKVRG